MADDADVYTYLNTHPYAYIYPNTREVVMELETSNGLWQQTVRARYFKRRTNATVQPRFNEAPCWKAIIKVKEVYFLGRKNIINDGRLTRLWHDPWMLDHPSKNEFPVMFDICQNQDCTLAYFVAKGCVSSFCGRLFGELADSWSSIVSRLIKCRRMTILIGVLRP